MVLSMSRPWKHPTTGIYYFRKAVPDDLRHAVGKWEVKRSLGTKDPVQARRQHAVVAAQVDAEWAELRRRDAAMARPALAELDEATIKRIGEAYLAHLLDEDEERRLEGFGSAPRRAKVIALPEPHVVGRAVEEEGFQFPTFDEAVASQEEFEGGLRHDYARGSADEFMLSEVDEVLSWEGFEITLTPNSPSRKRVARELQASAIRAAAAIRARDGGDPVETPAFPPPLSKVDPPQARSLDGEQSLMFLFEGWEREQRAAAITEKTIKEYRSVVTRFVSFVGHGDASRITPHDVVSWKDKRIADGLSPKTVKDVDLSALKSVFGWAARNHKLPSNPAAGVTIKLGKEVRTRGKGFTDEEANAILAAALRYVATPEEHAKTAAAKRWLPWLLAYTGARVGEVAQLRCQDVRRDGDHWTMTITPAAGPVKNKEAREVPLHPHLAELGFIDFVNSSEAGYLFLTASGLADVQGRLQAVKNRVREFVRGIVTDAEVAPNHAWRHRFVSECRKYRVDVEKRRMITGHAGQGVDEKIYGEPEGLYAEVCKLPRYTVAVQDAKGASNGLPNE